MRRRSNETILSDLGWLATTEMKTHNKSELLNALDKARKEGETQFLSELTTNIESLPILEWKKKYPAYYQWLRENGFKYDERQDIGQNKVTKEWRCRSLIIADTKIGRVVQIEGLINQMDDLEQDCLSFQHKVDYMTCWNGLKEILKKEGQSTYKGK